ncbi:MAG: FAD-dependent oxidoreductase [Pseudomonadales bacterium]|nr:FAD-dependent oxidoreductase [Pseudomonadales bacterium]
MVTPNNTQHAQLIILGGGIAGLWLLNRLCNAGYDTVLIEKSQLGSGQTLASQGIIHGGLKYALNGVLSPASSAIATMPARWRDCLAGTGEIDLRDCRILSPHYYLWSSSGYRSRLKTFLGSKALRGRITQLTKNEYPEFFRDAENGAARGNLYQLTDFVVDTPSLLKVLSQRWQHRIFQAREVQVQAESSSKNTAGTAIASLRVVGQGINEKGINETELTLRAERYLLCAGEGNETLLQALRAAQPQMQRRPLHMVWLKLKHPQPAFVHCIGDSFGMTPKLTVTSHPEPPDSAHAWTWYLGGELAETGIKRSSQTQIDTARTLLTTLFPWVDTRTAKWGSFMINRAEPRVATLQRPDTAWLSACHNYLMAWPTKLTLSPNLGDAALAALQEQQILPAHPAPASLPKTNPVLTSTLLPASIGTARWEP